MKLQTKFFIAGFFSAILVLCLVAVSQWAFSRKQSQIEAMDLVARITQRHMEGDMMHDAIRGDVLSAILARTQSNSGDIDVAAEELTSHYDNFKENLTSNQAENLPDEIKSVFNEALAALEEYNKSARQVILTTKQGYDYTSAYQDFKEKFDVMEEENEAISEKIQAWATSINSEADAFSSIATTLLIIISCISLAAASFIPFYSTFTLFKPQRSLIKAMQDITNGKLDIKIIGDKRNDEIGEISKTVAIFRENAVKKIELEENQKRQELLAAEEKKKAMEDLATKFESRVQGIISTVSSAATQLYSTSDSMTKIMSEASLKANSVSSASEEAAHNVNAVASATEEMSASVSEIAQQITKSTSAVKLAVAEMQKADQTSKMLEDATNRIGEIVDLIQDIAGQINLLALNATIESARAGEAGKGFAVVANEVKSLANQTTTATDEIASNIGSIQEVSKQVIHALGSIKSAIENVDSIASAISAAVEEQSAATNEIASNMGTAASKTSEINNDIGGVSAASTKANESANQVLGAAKMLSVESEKLNSEVATFLSEIRHG